MYTEVVFVKFPKAEKVLDNGFLLMSAGCLGDIAWIFNERSCVEIGRKPVKDSE